MVIHECLLLICSLNQYHTTSRNTSKGDTTNQRCSYPGLQHVDTLEKESLLTVLEIYTLAAQSLFSQNFPGNLTVIMKSAKLLNYRLSCKTVW